MNESSTLRLGTRGSQLARWQANWVASQLDQAGVAVELVLISTRGDVTSGPLGAAGGVGLFTKEIQRALLDDEIDLAVHSLKDLPTEPVEGLTLSAVPPRESNQDALVSRELAALDELPPGARVGTGSARRKAQLLHHRGDLHVLDIRGNVDTRLGKLDAGEYDAIVLAEAGLKRLELADRVTEVLDRSIMLPAVGQGALGLEIRVDDLMTAKAIAVLDDELTHAAVDAERTLLATLRGGCIAPVGAWARYEGETLVLDAIVLSHDGREKAVASHRSDTESPQDVGRKVALQLLEQGADSLIQSARHST